MVISMLGQTLTSQSAISGPSLNKLHPKRAFSSPIVAPSVCFRKGTISVPGDSLETLSNFDHTLGRLWRSTAITVAPRARSCFVGPIAAPAPNTTNAWFFRSFCHPSLLWMKFIANLVAGTAEGSITSLFAQSLTFSSSLSPDKISPFPTGTANLTSFSPKLKRPFISLVSRDLLGSRVTLSMAWERETVLLSRTNTNSLYSLSSPPLAIARASSPPHSAALCTCATK
mmetsp:Transcript_20043/g.27919  ORF Transcript_20043/g.27919 Transcript_20043/m.27919 type:complete len:228 (-) Transcript_20043:172-855(-)